MHGFAYERIPHLDKMRRIKEAPVDRTTKVEKKETLEERVKGLGMELEIAESKVSMLQKQLVHVQHKHGPGCGHDN